ncbi:MAG: NAD(P)-binding domain-containing protein [Tissierellia bacterium]|nr:NAD(P)-binding domain-containing protein [Tissierellia bacterium]
MKTLGIIGTGHVGQAVAYTAAMGAVADEILLADAREDKARAAALDLQDAGPFFPRRVKIAAVDVAELARAEVIVVATGLIVSEGDNADRLLEFEGSVRDVAEYIPKIVSAGFGGIFVVVTNPNDVIAHAVWRFSGFNPSRVLGSGTALDSARARVILSRALELHPSAVDACMLGEHGESQFLPWSQVRVGGMALEEYLKASGKSLDRRALEREVVDRGRVIYFGKGATEFGIANTTTAMVASIFRDEKRVFLASTQLKGAYGVEGIHLSTPVVVGSSGVEEVLTLDLSAEELEKYRHSASVVASYVQRIDEVIS